MLACSLTQKKLKKKLTLPKVQPNNLKIICGELQLYYFSLNGFTSNNLDLKIKKNMFQLPDLYSNYFNQSHL